MTNEIEITSKRILFDGEYTNLYKISYDENVAYIKGEKCEYNKNIALITDVDEFHVIILSWNGFQINTYNGESAFIFGLLVIYKNESEEFVVEGTFHMSSGFGTKRLIAINDEYIVMSNFRNIGQYFFYEKNDTKIFYLDSGEFIGKYIEDISKFKIVKDKLYFEDSETKLISNRIAFTINQQEPLSIMHMCITPAYFVKSLVTQKSKKYRARIFMILMVLKFYDIRGMLRLCILSFL